MSQTNHPTQHFNTREEYWESIRTSLVSTRYLSGLLERSGGIIQVTEGELTLAYKISSGHYIHLEINEFDTRSAPFTILAEGTYEGFLENLILKLAKSANVFLDIGANAGLYSVSAALSHPKLSVHAFEPNPRVAEVLKRNAIRNSVDSQVKIHTIGLSDNSGVSKFYVPSFTGTGGGSLMDLHPEEDKLEEISVQLETVDSLLLTGVDLIKIDVEGNEYSTILGGLSLIKSQTPTLVIELLRKWMKPFGKHPQDVLKLLEPLGYSCFAVGETDLRAVTEVNDETAETNFLFIHETSKDHMSIASAQNLKAD